MKRAKLLDEMTVGVVSRCGSIVAVGLVSSDDDELVLSSFIDAFHRKVGIEESLVSWANEIGHDRRKPVRVKRRR